MDDFMDATWIIIPPTRNRKMNRIIILFSPIFPK